VPNVPKTEEKTATRSPRSGILIVHTYEAQVRDSVKQIANTNAFRRYLKPYDQAMNIVLVSQGVIACNKGNPLLCYFSMSRSLRKWRSCRYCRRPFRLVLIRPFISLLILATFSFVLCFCNKYILNFSVLYSC
jgi:hypothetical protein